MPSPRTDPGRQTGEVNERLAAVRASPASKLEVATDSPPPPLPGSLDECPVTATSTRHGTDLGTRRLKTGIRILEPIHDGLPPLGVDVLQDIAYLSVLEGLDAATGGRGLQQSLGRDQRLLEPEALPDHLLGELGIVLLDRRKQTTLLAGRRRVALQLSPELTKLRLGESRRMVQARVVLRVTSHSTTGSPSCK